MRVRSLIGLALVLLLACIPGWTKELSNKEREDACGMLDAIAADIKQYYYDRDVHGIDFYAKVEEAKQYITSRAQSYDEVRAAVAHALDSLDDPHTYLVPDWQPVVNGYGFRLAPVGDRWYITRVKPGSDAAAQGLAPGDEVLSVNGIAASRANYHRMVYFTYSFQPKSPASLEVRSLDGQRRTVRIRAHLVRQYAYENGSAFCTSNFAREFRLFASYELAGGVLAARLQDFVPGDDGVQGVLRQLREQRALLLDLRGNPSGDRGVYPGLWAASGFRSSLEFYWPPRNPSGDPGFDANVFVHSVLVPNYEEDALKILVGGLFDHDVKIADRVGREPREPLVAKRSKDPFQGKVVVLIDAGSARYSELLARVIQIEKRGTVIGDRSSGNVRENFEIDYSYHPDRSNRYRYFPGYFQPPITLKVMVAGDAVQMSDGTNLEGRGVKPDELILPTPQDPAAGRDPVLARGAALLGVQLSPEKAYTLFPFKWNRPAKHTFHVLTGSCTPAVAFTSAP
jgi:C-terminal processing protease CtpA/Prc